MALSLLCFEQDWESKGQVSSWPQNADLLKELVLDIPGTATILNLEEWLSEGPRDFSDEVGSL